MSTRDRGGGGIEMAIILPLLLFCVFAVAHLGMYYLAQQAALSVAQVAVEGERGWLAEPGAGQQRAENFLAQLPEVLTGTQISVTNDGEQVTATVTADTVTVIPWLNHTVSQTASAPVERLT
ncbi:pilus assembly protein [Natronosporangium hydrolyticum]|uniref:Pilus assembly protein n=1 Tax=Natronosporangium hydrolyticum TaxID=2811111 RepID=A0A895YB06_9ACTN|nr:TadE family protein [Natronosporangium hydrolyticum]QSB14927.1 pilus assembly protein [Natronosporangium hydrolyticum]